MPDLIRAIETDYRGVCFRSRLEAKWAAFFDLCSWGWQYEPIDLNGYIPDFVLQLPHDPVIVEVKPELYLPDLLRYRKKVEESGWQHESLIVGACIFNGSDDWPESAVIGILDQRCEEPGPDSGDAHNWSPCVLEQCTKCGCLSFIHSEFTWSCRVNGCYEGDHYVNALDYDSGFRMFADASRQVRWNP